MTVKTIVVITGGAGGMGLATARMVGVDHHVILSDLNQERLEAARDALSDEGISCDTAVCDITDRASVDQLVAVASAAGRVKAVIHTAGLSPQMADPATILRVNALGTVNIGNAFYATADEGFALVNVASMAAHLLPGWLIPRRAYALALTDMDRLLKKLGRRCRLMPRDFYRRGMAYSLSKHFVMWYSEARAGAFGAKGARVLSVSPGSFDTQMGRLEEASGSADMLKTAALRRFGRPEEIAELLAFCASDRASYITGVDILCDGGVVASRRHR